MKLFKKFAVWNPKCNLILIKSVISEVKTQEGGATDFQTLGTELNDTAQMIHKYADNFHEIGQRERQQIAERGGPNKYTGAAAHEQWAYCDKYHNHPV